MKKTKIASLLAAGVLALGSAFGLAGCGEGTPSGQLGRGTTLYVQVVNYTQETDKAFERLATVYNETQGKEDDIEVLIDEQTTVKDFTSSLKPGKKNKFDIMTISNEVFKTTLVNYFDGANVMVPLDDYLADPEFTETLGLEYIPETSMDMWKMTQESDKDGMFYAGAGQPQLAQPFFNDPQVLFYNKEIFTELGINMISVAEEDLEAYNTAHSTKLQPHGYAEYTAAAVGGDLAAKTSTNEKGETVVKVFNNRIPMNWDELRAVATQYQAENPDRYGFMSEWWFNYGWSVGGDCIGWDSDAGRYVLSLGDETPGLLVIDDTLTVNGTPYYQGDVLDYEDLHSLSETERQELIEAKSVTELPSMYDAFVEFNRLGVPKDKSVTDAAHGSLKGYGIAPNTTMDRAGNFSDGLSPLLCEYYSTQHNYTAKLGDAFDIAPLAQYREFVGGSVDDDGYLKVIDGTTYTGELATAENSDGEKVPVIGEAVTVTEPQTAAMFLPANADPDKRDAAFKYMAWACGPEGQKILAEGGTSVPNQTSLLMEDEEYLASAGVALDNMYAALFANSNTYVGDWSYDANGTWVGTWSNTLNTEVRRGDITLDAFLAPQSVANANNAIKGITVYTKRT